MAIGDRIRTIRERKGLSQGDIVGRSGMSQSYISRVENGRVVPSLEILERFARALEVPLYELFYEGELPPALPTLSAEEVALQQEKRSMFERLAELFSKLTPEDKKILIQTAERLGKR